MAETYEEHMRQVLAAGGAHECASDCPLPAMTEDRVPHPPDCDCPTCRADYEEQKARAMTEDRVRPHPWIAHDFDCECHDALCGRCGCTNPYTPEQPAPPLDVERDEMLRVLADAAYLEPNGPNVKDALRRLHRLGYTIARLGSEAP